MKSSFWSLLGIHIYKVQSLYSFIIGVTLSIVLWIYKEDKQISLLLFLLVSMVSVLLISSLISAVLDLINNSMVLPKVERVMTSAESQTRILLSPSKLFSHGTMVSLYFTNEHQFETLICVGTVLNVQENKKIQIGISKIIEGQEDIMGRMSSNDQSVLKEVTVKPTIPYDYI